MIRRHLFSALTTILVLIAIVLLAANLERAAVYVTLAAIVLAFVGAGVTAAHRRS